MRLSLISALAVGCLFAGSSIAWADEPPEGPSTPGRVPLAAPPSKNHVPVPDVRGMSEPQARRVLSESGLRLGSVERVSAANLQRQLGKNYRPGIIVQQAPRPSVGENPSWLRRGGVVHLRMCAGVAAPGPAAPQPQPQPGPLPQPDTGPVPTPPTRAPTPGEVTIPYTGGVPPPPYALDGSPQAQPVAPTVPFAPVLPVVPCPDPCPPGATPPSVVAPLDVCPPAPSLLPTRSRSGLPCECNECGWHVRGLGGFGFPVSNQDAGDAGPVAGADIGYTFAGCWGVDVFYRYLAVRYDRTTGGGTLQDGGDTHFIGGKITYQTSISRGSDWYLWAGAGAGWFKTRRLTADDDGLGILGEVGVGYMIGDSVRIRVGAMVTALNSSAGRMLAANDGTKRWVVNIAPVAGLQIDL